MHENDATEQAYKNGYVDGMRNAMRLLQDELEKVPVKKPTNASCHSFKIGDRVTMIGRKEDHNTYDRGKYGTVVSIDGAPPLKLIVVVDGEDDGGWFIRPEDVILLEA